jgi:hypothetical protein
MMKHFETFCKSNEIYHTGRMENMVKTWSANLCHV